MIRLYNIILKVGLPYHVIELSIKFQTVYFSTLANKILQKVIVVHEPCTLGRRFTFDHENKTNFNFSIQQIGETQYSQDVDNIIGNGLHLNNFQYKI